MCGFQKSTDDMDNINLEELDLTTDEFVLDEVDSRSCFKTRITRKKNLFYSFTSV